jgi:hypothetical protein
VGPVQARRPGRFPAGLDRAEARSIPSGSGERLNSLPPCPGVDCRPRRSACQISLGPGPDTASKGRACPPDGCARTRPKPASPAPGVVRKKPPKRPFLPALRSPRPKPENPLKARVRSARRPSLPFRLPLQGSTKVPPRSARPENPRSESRSPLARIPGPAPVLQAEARSPFAPVPSRSGRSRTCPIPLEARPNSEANPALLGLLVPLRSGGDSPYRFRNFASPRHRSTATLQGSILSSAAHAFASHFHPSQGEEILFRSGVSVPFSAPFRGPPLFRLRDEAVMDRESPEAKSACG